MRSLAPYQIALAVGGVALALLAGALGFQFIDGLPPCEMCWWQRYPHIASAIVGIGGGMLTQFGAFPRSLGKPVAMLAILAIAISGAIGVFHAGVEWHWWKGPDACTGGPFHGPMDLHARVVMCDIAAWRLFGLSLAGYNALISLATALLGTIALLRSGNRP